ncbi:MAG: hypothetical protein QM790_04320 [Nibricoccus sp.]
MKPLLFAVICVTLFAGCRTSESLGVRERLKALPEWLTVRKAAQGALARNESTSLGWRTAMSANETGALYPIKKEGELWLVQACDDYPQNRYGMVVEMEITSSGEVRRYTQLWKQKKHSLFVPDTQVLHAIRQSLPCLARTSQKAVKREAKPTTRYNAHG